ncbi:MAG TPA: transketolase C-terminal domain-containing protein, partial [Planctomycetota bacterium]|nr:transketolase C-terminal domain-containing protein [Planctomycetota bacterium]
ALISTGSLVKAVVDAAEILATRGIQAAVLSMHTVKPLDSAAIARVAGAAKLLVTVEEHSLIGGLGSAVAESVVDQGLGVRMLRLGLEDRIIEGAGSHAWLKERAGLTAEKIAGRVEEAVKKG